MFYGNGTARLVRDSAWRDQGTGVLPDLGSHLLDTALFWFGDRRRRSRSSRRTASRTARSITSRSARTAQPVLQLEVTLLTWRNHFYCRRLRGEGQRPHPVALQVGAEHVHRPRPRCCPAAVRTRSR